MLVFLVEISVKYQISVVLETISGTDYRSTEILAKSSKYRFRSDISVSVGQCAAAGGREHKKSLIFSKKSTINRWFVEKIVNCLFIFNFIYIYIYIYTYYLFIFKLFIFNLSFILNLYYHFILYYPFISKFVTSYYTLRALS